MTWNTAEAIGMCCEIEAVVPTYGCHIALTGGLLYKAGPRKDADILFYRIRQATIDWGAMWAALERIGLKKLRGKQGWWCIKAEWNGKPVDCFFPDYGDDGSYGNEVSYDTLDANGDPYFAFVDCAGHDEFLLACGTHGLTKQAYMRQMERPNVKWRCPSCGGTAEYNDEASEKAQGVVA